MKLVLDTNIYCDFAEGLPDVVQAMIQYGEFICLPSVVSMIALNEPVMIAVIEPVESAPKAISDGFSN